MKKFTKKYNSIDQFSVGETYETKDGQKVVVDGIDNKPKWKKVHFVLNDSIRDMKNHDTFLKLMNGEGYSIMDF